jgi:hypothetical protein
MGSYDQRQKGESGVLGYLIIRARRSSDSVLVVLELSVV